MCNECARHCHYRAYTRARLFSCHQLQSIGVLYNISSAESIAFPSHRPLGETLISTLPLSPWPLCVAVLCGVFFFIGISWLARMDLCTCVYQYQSRIGLYKFHIFVVQYMYYNNMCARYTACTRMASAVKHPLIILASPMYE